MSKLRCLITLVSFVLLVTDVPRTGLGVRSLQEYYPVALMPSTAVRFGPFNYPVAHIFRLGNDTAPVFVGAKGNQPITAVPVWSYKYDTASLGLRGAVELLNVTEFPAFLLYKHDREHPITSASSLIGLHTAFMMIDSFVSAAHAHLHPEALTANSESRTLRYATKHNWVDRIHHYVVSFISKNPAWSLHSLHVTNVSRRAPQLSICSIGKRPSPRPRFCNHPGIWKCTNPLNASLPTVRLWDHMDLRLQSLSQRYPGLELDVTVISTQRLSSTSGALRSTFYNYEALEIVVLTRGRRCVSGNNSATSPSNSVTCSTVFVDDYRYERDIVETNLVDWYGVVAMLRGGAQTYVWVRLLLLGYGAYEAAGPAIAGALSLRSRVLSAVLVILKIPFHVIVYSSLLPIVSYVIALFLDSSFMDLFLESYWASVAGAINFELVPFIQSSAVQMRNVWLLALFASVVVFAVAKIFNHGNYGIPGIRGLLISFTSTLSVAGPYKNAAYRDTNIVSIFCMPDEGQALGVLLSNPGGFFNTSSYIFDKSATMLRFCVVAVMILALIFAILGYFVHWIRRATRGAIMDVSVFAPCGVVYLWQRSSSCIFFSVMLRPDSIQCDSAHATLHRQIYAFTRHSAYFANVKSSPTLSFISAVPSTTRIIPISPISQPNASQCRSHMAFGRDKVAAETTDPPNRDCSARTTALHSILQLMNVAMMTDPWNLFCLRGVGIQLYLYKIRCTRGVAWESKSSLSSFNVVSYAVILPFSQDELEDLTGLSAGQYQLIDTINSRDVPMSILLQSG